MTFKIKNQNYENKVKNRIQIKRYEDQRFSFNFSFMTPNDEQNLTKRGKHINKEIRSRVLNKIWFLSQEDINTVMSYPKETGLEALDINDVHVALSPEFEKSGRKLDVDNCFWIFRLNKFGRVICMKQKHIFYIISIDTEFKTYKH